SARSAPATSTSPAPIRNGAATVVLHTQEQGTEGGGIRGHTRDTAGPEQRHQVVESQALAGARRDLDDRRHRRRPDRHVRRRRLRGPRRLLEPAEMVDEGRASPSATSFYLRLTKASPGTDRRRGQ